MRPEVQRYEIQARGIIGAHWTDNAICEFAVTSPPPECTLKVSVLDFRGDRLSTAACRQIAWSSGNHDRDKEDIE